jgi:hypothetical protein
MKDILQEGVHVGYMIPLCRGHVNTLRAVVHGKVHIFKARIYVNIAQSGFSVIFPQAAVRSSCIILKILK